VVRSAAQAKESLVCLAALGVQIEMDMLCVHLEQPSWRHGILTNNPSRLELKRFLRFSQLSTFHLAFWLATCTLLK
jgi:hypothetical protein